MEKEFVPYAQSVELKQLGYSGIDFAGWCHAWENNPNPYFRANVDEAPYDVSAPLYQQAFQFLLDQLEFVSITYFNDGSGNLKTIGFKKPIVDFDTRLECLVELINLVKLKK
jgi:hypothetical protein